MQLHSATPAVEGVVMTYERGHIIIRSELLVFCGYIDCCHALLKSGCRLAACMHCYQQHTHSNRLPNKSVETLQAIDVLQQWFHDMRRGPQVY